MPTVSIIVPNFNHGKYLQKRLDSIFAQTFRDYEVILLDDCSTDDSVELLRKYAQHPNVSHIIFNERNSGSTFIQWEKGLELAKGDFIWIAESDDWSDTSFLERLIPSIQHDPECALVYCQSNVIDKEGKIVKIYDWCDQLAKNRWKQDFHTQGSQEIADYLVYQNTIPNASAVIFRRSIAEAVGVPINKTFTGDWIFWMRILSKGNIRFNASCLNYFRISEQSVSISDYNIQKELMRFREFFDAITEGFKLINAPTKFSIFKHHWIVQHWINKRHILFPSRKIFFYPPFPLKLKFYFYILLMKKILSQGLGRKKIAKEI